MHQNYTCVTMALKAIACVIAAAKSHPTKGTTQVLIPRPFAEAYLVAHLTW
jgi:hypothetical protein